MMKHVLIVTRRGVVVGVSVSANQHLVRREAERIEGSAITWQNYVSHIGAHSRRDVELTYTIHKAAVL
jgi:hypothetical protein